MALKTVTPIASKEGIISYGGNGLNVERIFGISCDQFLQIHESLSEKGLRVITESAKSNIVFALYCSRLLDSGAEVDALIGEFNKAQKGDGSEMWHALSLSKLYWQYHSAGYSVSINRTHKTKSSADLVIEDIGCELKTRIDQGEVRMRPFVTQLLEGKISNEEYQDKVFSYIRSMEDDLNSSVSRIREGFNQAACVFLDLSSHFHSWDYHRLESLVKKDAIKGISSDPILPIAGTCILFSPDNALDLRESSFNPKAFMGCLPIEGMIDG